MPVINLIKNKAAPSFCTSNQEVLKMIILYCKRKNLPCLIEAHLIKLINMVDIQERHLESFIKILKNIKKK